MIAKHKQHQALLSLNLVLIEIRNLAYIKADHLNLAAFLDHAEYLPLLIAESDDRTDDFRKVLETMARANSGFNLALQRFDDRE